MKIEKISDKKIKELKTVKQYSSDNTKQIYLGVFGIFDTFNVKWSYYVCPLVKDKLFFFTIDIKITNDILSGYSTSSIESLTINNLTKYGKKFNSIKEGNDFINDFKIKWETRSNDSKNIIREEKLNEILK